MRLAQLQEAQYAPTRPNLDWMNEEQWNSLTTKQQNFVSSFHEILTSIRNDMIESNQEWADEYGRQLGEGWELWEQVAETDGWSDLPDEITEVPDEGLEWMEPVFELISDSVWSHDYDYSYYDKYNAEDD